MNKFAKVQRLLIEEKRANPSNYALVVLTFGNMAYDAMLGGKTGVMSARVKGCLRAGAHP